LSRTVPDTWFRHPFVTRLQGYIGLTRDHWRLIEAGLTVSKRRDLIAGGYEYRKFCFAGEG
jgi:hypothetical protein